MDELEKAIDAMMQSKAKVVKAENTFEESRTALHKAWEEYNLAYAKVISLQADRGFDERHNN